MFVSGYLEVIERELPGLVIEYEREISRSAPEYRDIAC